MIVLSIVMLFSLAIGVGCNCGGTEDPSGNGGGYTPIEKTPTVSLDKSSEKLIVGDYLTITAYTNKVLEEDVVFESENESVATVNKHGQIEAISGGTTNIVAKYGKATAKCAITVVWDDSFPVLVDSNGFELNYIVFKNSSYTFRPAIEYRGRLYNDVECAFYSTNEEIATFDGNQLKANSISGVVNCYVEASWRGFDATTVPLLRCDFAVEVRNEAYISLKGTSEDFIELYTHSEFDGKNYVNSGVIIPEFYANGEKVEGVEFTTVIKDATLASYDGTTLVAEKYGSTTVEISCEYEGETYIKSIDIEITRPVADYKEEIKKFSLDVGTFKDEDNNFVSKTIAEEIYGNNDVEIIEAYENGLSLIIEDNKILGVKGSKEGVTNTVITIGTNTEIYNVALEVYGLYITEMADFNIFTKAESPNYYYLANDIDATDFAFTESQNNSATGFTGVFEGNGYVISNITTTSKGIFGIVNGGTIRNVAFTNVNLTGYYPCLFAHSEKGSATLKNIYVEVDSIAVRGSALFQQTMAAAAKHENIVVEYGISKEDVKTTMAKKDNQANISTFAPNRGTVYKDTTFKNCFSISYAPVGCSSPKGTDFTWTSHIMAENQVVLGDANDDGDIPLTGVTDWDKELLAFTTPTDVLKVTASVSAAKDVSTGTDVLKGVKAYATLEDLINDEANNTEILASFDKNFWVVLNGVPYWKGVYKQGFTLQVKQDGYEVDGNITLINTNNEVSLDLIDVNGSVVDSTITAPEGIIVSGNKIKLASNPTSVGYYEVKVSAIVEGVVIEKWITVNYTNLITVTGKVLYSQDDKSLDLPSLNLALNRAGIEDITLSDIESYLVNGEQVEELDLEVIISNNTSKNLGRNRAVDTAQSVTIVVDGKEYVLENVYAYTKLIDEAEDIKFFTMNYRNEYNEIDGYFLVTKNIDASELVLEEHKFEANKNLAEGAKPILYPGNGYNVDVGFRGVLDGQGYTIDGLTTKTCGLFAGMNAPVVKNIAFTNVNITGYYGTLFAQKYSRGKDYNNGFNGYEGAFINMYVSINSINYVGSNGAIGILVYGTLPANTIVHNVIIDYVNVSEKAQELITAGKQFYMFGASTASMADKTSRFKNSYSISQAPVLQLAKMPGFAENQVEFTLSADGKKVASVGNALVSQVADVLARCGKTLTVDHVLVGLRAYDNYEAMALDTANDYSSFSADYWAIENGVPTWKNV